jgi:hypothetical protein
LIATPEMSWLPFRVIEARPWRRASAEDAAIAATRPIHAEPDTAAMAPAAKAAASILPSRPMSKMPARSE